MSAPLVPTSPATLATLGEIDERSRQYASASKAENTKRAYTSDWADFTAWCGAHALTPLPAAAGTIRRYLTDRAATCKVSTLQRRLAAIAKAHQLAKVPSPTHDPEVREVWSGIRRTHGTAPTRKAAAVTDDMRAMVATLPDSLLGVRDRALLLLGFAGAFRRSELVGLDVGDVSQGREGLTVVVRRSKTDQEGAGLTKAIPHGANPDTCPVRAYLAWLAQSGITADALFRPIDRHGRMGESRLSGHAVARVVKRAAEAAGLDDAQYSGHSLRAGLVTSAALAGVGLPEIMEQTGHKQPDTVLKYVRAANKFKNNAAAKVGL